MNRVFELDSLRGIAALSVCLLHFGLFNYGISGIELFFMISGFVIYMSIEKKDIKTFIVSRLSRLLPVYWLSIIVAFSFCSLCFFQPNWRFVFGNLLMLQPVFRTEFISIAYWTLYIEMLFYFSICLLWKLRLIEKIDTVLLLLLIAIAALEILYQFGFVEHFFIVSRGLFPIVGYFNLFASGIVYFQMFSKGINLKRIILLLIAFSLTGLTHNDYGPVKYFINLPVHLLIVLIYNVAFISIVLKKASLLKAKPLVFLGAISYPLYLIHSTFGLWFKRFIDIYFISGIGTVMGGLMSILFAFLINNYFDLPIQSKLKMQFIAKKPAKLS